MAQAQVHAAKMSVRQIAELRAQVINDYAAVSSEGEKAVDLLQRELGGYVPPPVNDARYESLTRLGRILLPTCARACLVIVLRDMTPNPILAWFVLM